MRRKLILSLALFSLFITCFVCSFAEKKEATIRRPLTEFCELYMKRIMEFNDNYGQNTGGLDTRVSSPLVPPFEYESMYFVDSKGGALDVNKSDLTIIGLYTAIMDVNAKEQEGHNVVLTALIAISALEADDRDASMIELQHVIDKTRPENIIMKYLDEYTNIIHPAISSNIKRIEAGEDVLVYQGNYDYYVNYSKEAEQIFLCAQERQ